MSYQGAVPNSFSNLTLQQLIQQALTLHRAGRLAEAERLYREALALDPNFYLALHLMGLLRLQQGRAAEALPLIEGALRIKPDAAETQTNYGIVLDALGRFDEALAAQDRAARAQPQNSRSWCNRGAALSKLGRNAEALADFDRALSLDAGNIEAWHNRGLILTTLFRPAEALESYDRALALRPVHIEAHNDRGLALKALGRASEALTEFARVLALKPDHAGALVNRASVLWGMGRIDEALADYDHALAIDPDMPQALSSRYNLLWTRKGAVEAAIADLNRLVTVAPDFPYAQGDLLHLKMHTGDWRDFARERAALDEGVRAGRRVVEPYVYQALSDSPADLLTCARIYAADRYPARPALFAKSARRPGRLRLGYLCGEFRSQATMYLAAGLFECHDRDRFEVVGFDNSRDDNSPTRARVIQAFDKFYPIQTLSDRDAAALVAAADIDILVNLNGYFGALRMGVFAQRPAPLQVNYLGFPGTLGAEYIDYILADAEVIAQSEQRFFTEKVVILPDSYQINDDRRASPVSTSRADHGLGENAFVFCHFNYGYKITPQMFALWMRLLAHVPESVLWLLESNFLFAENLKAQARGHGIDPARIIFAPRLEQEAHLSRLALGDLFLDSLPYNAHTTASDALWAGLPLLTCRGSAFAGRVAASLLRAVGLPELITYTLEGYEALALRLVKDRDLLRAYRTRLAQARAKAPLFDTSRTTRNIEMAYEEMLARWTRGEPPGSFCVPSR